MTSSFIRFTKDHEYIRVEGNTAIVGITNFAQEQLGDIVFVELPPVGKLLKQGDEAAVVESVKAASEIYCPASGTVTEVNLSTPSDLDGLMDEAAYADMAK
jgi:glycine cleavage system H protein